MKTNDARVSQEITRNVVSVLLAVIIVAGVLIPIVSDFENASTVKYNNLYGTYAVLHEDGSAVVTITEDNEYLLNGEHVDVSSQEYVIMFDQGYLRYSSTAHEFNWELEGTSHHISTLPQTYTIANGMVHAVIGAAEYDIPYTWCGIASNSGDYRILATSGSVKTVYVEDFDQVYSVRKNDDHISSTHGYEITYLPDIYTNASIQINRDAIVDSSNPIYELGITYTAEQSDYVMKVQMDGETFSYSNGNFLIPYEAVGISDSDNMALKLLQILPILIICSLLIYIVNWTKSQKME